MHSWLALAHFSPTFYFYTAWERQKTTFSGGIDMEHLANMGYTPFFFLSEQSYKNKSLDFGKKN